VVRLDTSFRYSDPQRMITYGAGDTINGGLAWTRPVRIGGLQAQSNFLLRPDLVTIPLPSMGGSAAVPSTVDVYINNMKTFSQEVPAGPFGVSNIPLLSGAGNAELVIRDSAGHETKSTLPFYASSSLLYRG
jgi:outer membrane usher protein